jgi:P27 family predicted phage terminase small subunit
MVLRSVNDTLRSKHSPAILYSDEVSEDFEPPVELSDTAAEKWHEVVAYLRQNDTLGAQDHGIIAAYCTTYALMIRTSSSIENGEVLKNDIIKLHLKLCSQVKEYSDKLGLNPRSRVSVKKRNAKPKANPNDAFFRSSH